VKPFLLVRFLCGFPKKMNSVVGPGPDGVDCPFLVIKPFKPSGLAPTGDWLSLKAERKPAKKWPLSAALGMTVQLVGVLVR
jgi:hypothetical protein